MKLSLAPFLGIPSPPLPHRNMELKAKLGLGSQAKKSSQQYDRDGKKVLEKR